MPSKCFVHLLPGSRARCKTASAPSKLCCGLVPSMIIQQNRFLLFLLELSEQAKLGWLCSGGQFWSLSAILSSTSATLGCLSNTTSRVNLCVLLTSDLCCPAAQMSNGKSMSDGSLLEQHLPWRISLYTSPRQSSVWRMQAAQLKSAGMKRESMSIYAVLGLLHLG